MKFKLSLGLGKPLEWIYLYKKRNNLQTNYYNNGKTYNTNYPWSAKEDAVLNLGCAFKK